MGLKSQNPRRKHISPGQTPETVAAEVEEILALDWQTGHAKEFLIPNYERLALRVETRASLHPKGRVHALEVANALRSRGWAEVGRRAAFTTSGGN
jgi:hypothetical protein